jgi:2-hydroxychromene-2-carboxylate isomerase
MALIFALLRAVRAEERDTADRDEVREIAKECGIEDGRLLKRTRDTTTRETFDRFTREAIEAGVFGTPSYVVDGEIFWGQDRLDFLEERFSGAVPRST